MRLLALFSALPMLALVGCECHAMPFTLRVKRATPDAYAKLCPTPEQPSLHASR